MSDTDLCVCGHPRSLHFGTLTACETGAYMAEWPRLLGIKACLCVAFVLDPNVNAIPKSVLANRAV